MSSKPHYIQLSTVQFSFVVDGAIYKCIHKVISGTVQIYKDGIAVYSAFSEYKKPRVSFAMFIEILKRSDKAF